MGSSQGLEGGRGEQGAKVIEGTSRVGPGGTGQTGRSDGGRGKTNPEELEEVLLKPSDELAEDYEDQ